MSAPVPDTVALTRRYRRLLRCYPAEYRHERGEELIGTLLDATPPGRTWPAPAEVADLVVQGLRRRMREDATPGLAAGLRIAGPAALTLAAGLTVFLWLYVEWTIGGDSHIGPFRTLAPIAYAVWLAAAVGNAALSSAVARHDLVAAAVVATALLPPAAALTGAPRAPLWVVASLTMCGLIALAGRTVDQPVGTRRRILVGTLAVGAAPATAMRLWGPPAGSSGYYGPALHTAGILAAAVIAAVMFAGLMAERDRLRSPHRWWALFVLALPAAWLVSVGAAGDGLPVFGRLGQFLLAASTALAGMAWLANHRTARVDAAGVTGSRFVAATAIACAAGLSGYFWLSAHDAAAWEYAGWLLAATGWAVFPASWVRAPAAAATAITIIGYAVGDVPSYQAAVLTTLGMLAMAGGVPAREGRIRYGVPVTGTLTLLAAVGVGAYAHNWQLTGWRQLLDAPTLVAMLAVVPLVLGLAAGWQRRDTARRWLMVGAGSAGIAFLALPPAEASILAATVAFTAVVAGRRGEPVSVRPG